MKDLKCVDRCWIGDSLLEVGGEYNEGLIDVMIYNCDTEELTIRYDNLEEEVIDLSPSSVGFGTDVTIDFTEDYSDFVEEDDL